MGDFLLDFRSRDVRRRTADEMRFLPDMQVDCISRENFTLFVSRAGKPALWAPFEARDGTIVALAGQVALDADDWERARSIEGDGGLACKAVYRAYQTGGISALEQFSGAYSIHLHDPQRKAYYLVTDPAGALPCYLSRAHPGLLCSHPDLLADATDRNARVRSLWDLASMAQFVATGVVSFPYSYYRDIVALDCGSVHAFDLSKHDPPRHAARKYVDWDASQLSTESESQIVERLASAIAASSRRCTLPVLGQTAVALSGGLDSRTLLCTADRHPALLAFCAFDEENAEFAYAKAIADTLQVKLLPFKRPFDHYGDHAELGVMITGGMGELTSNHFLGFRKRLGELGIENLVTGCYFDYLFKSLALDAAERGILRHERFHEFSYRSYLPHFEVSATLSAAVRERMEALFSLEDRNSLTPEARSRIAAHRTFPLYHEGDNAQRLVPLRVMQWSPPALGRDVLGISSTMPPHLKLNKRAFRKVVQLACGATVSGIPDGNTGLPLTASPLRLALNRYRIALWRRIERRKKRMATAESWPNWTYYIQASHKLRTMWQRPNPVARDIISELTGRPFLHDITSYSAQPTQYFTRLLTLKLWLDQRTGSG